MRRQESEDERRARKLRMLKEERTKSAAEGSNRKVSKPNQRKIEEGVLSQPPRHDNSVNITEFIGQAQRIVKRSALDDNPDDRSEYD